MKMRRLCAYIMALFLVVSMPLRAFANPWYLDEGDITVSANQSGQTVSQGQQQDVPDSAPVISQSRPASDPSGNSGSGSSGSAGSGSSENTDSAPTENPDSAPTDNSNSTPHTITITADAGSTANVTLDGVNINSDGAAILTSGGGNVTIELDGENQVQSGYQHAGVEKQNSGNLTITDDSGSDGSLTANGGDGGAGIGGKIESGASDITISDGTVTATGGEGGAGIGGGAQGGNGSNITISGGTVEAYGGTDAAGIGGGYRGNGSNITISGGTTTATGGDPQETSGDKAVGGGAGIGGGAYGEGNNITIKYNAQVTATGKGNAANIGNGYASEATEKQKDKVDLSGLSSFGKVNGVSGGDDSFHASNGSSGSSGGSGGGSFVSFFGSNSGSNSSSSPSYKSRLDVKATLGKITSTDNDGNDLSNVVWLKEDSELDITAKEDKCSVTGNKADLLQLKEDGVKKINLQTNRVNVSVSNQVLDKITDSGGGFQLTADGTTVSLSSTDGNNQKTPGLKLTADKQPEKGKLQVDFLSEASMESAEDVRESLNKTLQVSTNAPEATLSYDQKFMQNLMGSEFSNLALAVGNLLATVDGMLGAITTVNGSGSITIGDNTVNMNGIQISANDSSGNSQPSQRIDEIMFQLRNQSQSGSAMNVTVTENSPVESVSLTVSKDNLQSLLGQGIAQTTLTVGDSTTGFKNSDVLKKLDDSRLDSAMVNHKLSANGVRDAEIGMFGEGANQLPFTPFFAD